MRITLIHALKHSIVPIEASFARLWPDATLMNLVDDSLSADLARDGRLTDAMTERFLSLGRYAARPAPTRSCSPARPSVPASRRSRAHTRRCRCSSPAKPWSSRPPRAAAGSVCSRPSRRRWRRCRAEFPGIVEIVTKLAEGAHGRAGSRRPRRTRSPRRRSLARSARLRPDRAGAIQHGAGGGSWSPRHRAGRCSPRRIARC